MSQTATTINLVHLPRVTSTMDVLDELIDAGAPEWTVVLADEQTAGLGRAGRSWVADPGSALLCSILVRPNFSVERSGMLAMAVGVALSECVESLGARVALKWPNDVLLDGRKLAGILIRTRRDPSGTVANIGIGMNLTIGSSVGPDGPERATLDQAVRRLPAVEVLLERLVLGLAPKLLDDKTSRLGDSWMARAAYVDEIVEIHDGGTLLTGKFLGIDDGGRLRLEFRDGVVQTIPAGDLVRGPRVEEG